jgi:hypothetical protein
MLKITTDSSVLKNSYVYVTFPVDKVSQKLPTVFQSLVIQLHWNFCFRNRTSFECLDILLLLLLLGIFQDNLFIRVNVTVNNSLIHLLTMLVKPALK